MDRRHLGAQNGVVLTHFFCKDNLVDGRGTNGAFLMPLFPDTYCGQEGADTDPGSTQIIDLINFQTGINLV